MKIVLKENRKEIEVRQGKRRGAGRRIRFTPGTFHVGDCVGPTADVDVYGAEIISSKRDASLNENCFKAERKKIDIRQENRRGTSRWISFTPGTL
jgi:hypothetical protein